jgi:hypothetical protein
MRALFVGGTIDNSEMDLDQTLLSVNYPERSGSGASRYRLYEVGRRDAEVVFAVYAAKDLDEDEVERVVAERDYERRFGVGADGVELVRSEALLAGL